MLSQQASLISDNPYLEEGDWIQLEYESLVLFSQGFKSAQVSMKANNESPLLSLFIIQHVNQSNKNTKKSIHFNEPVVLVHRLSSKYLSYTPNFANKSEFKLRSMLTDHCQFILRPLYKCQTIRGNIVKNKEQCMLSPAISQYASQNINLVVGKYQKNTLGKVPIFLKKNQFSSLRINRKNLEKKGSEEISNLLIYQLGHLQQKKLLSCSKNRENNTFKICFSPNHVGYDTLLMIQLYYDNPEEQIRIKSGDYIAIKFIGAKRYIGFDERGEVRLFDQKRAEAGFQIELYSNSKSLDIDSLIKIKHAKTQKYLSFNNNEVTVEEFSTFNIFQLNNLAPQELKNNLFINQVYNGLQEEFQDIANIKRKRGITSILKQIIKFIFKNKNIYEQFLSLQQVNFHITEEQQSLFAEIGFITLLKNISIYCFQQYQAKIIQMQDKKTKSIENINNQYNEEEHVYLQICIILAGICKNNRNSTVEFTQHIKVYFQHIGKIKANIQLLYHIYAFNTVGLEVLESQQFSIKKYQIKALELLCQFLYKRQFPIVTRTKLIQLFHGSIINGKSQKVYTHQQIMLTAFYENRLKNIMFTLSNNHQYELIVGLKGERQELSSMIDNQDTYQFELNLLYEQINLLTTLCSRASKKHVNLFRDIISEEMVKKYLKERLCSRFKSLFLKILVNIYLNKDLNVSPQALVVITNPKKKGFDENAPFRKFSNLSTLSNKLLEPLAEVQMEEVNQSKFKFMTNINSLNQIKELVKSIIKNRLQRNQIQSELIYCLYAISNFLQVGVCEENEGLEVLMLLANYLYRHYMQKKEFNNDLVQKFLELLQHSLQEKLKIKISSLFLKIRESFREGEDKLKYSKKIVNLCNQFMQKQLKDLINFQLYNLLYTIIVNFAQTQSYSIFLKSSKLYHKIDKIGYHFLEMIKGIIPIESDNSHQVLRKINKIYNSLTDYTIDYIYYHDNTVQISTLRKIITQIMNEAVELLENHQQEQPINIMAQKIMGEFNFFQIIIQMIYQREKDLESHDSDELFQTVFRFIKLFLTNSDENFFKNVDNLQKLKVLYRHQDRGQIKLLWDLTCMKVVTTRMNKFVFDCWMTAAKSTSKINIHVPLGFLKLLQDNEEEVNHTNNINNLIKLILNEHSFLQDLLRNMDKLEETFFNNQDIQSKQQWLFYLTFILKLLFILLEQSRESKLALLQCYRKYIPLKTLVKLIQQSFRLEFQNEKDNNIFLLISVKLVKKQLINTFVLLYLSAQNIQFEYLIYVAQRVAVRLTIKNDEIVSTDYIYKNLMFYNKHTQTLEQMRLRQILMDYLTFENRSNFEITPQDFHKYANNTYLFINIYYDFLYKICEKMIEIKLEGEDNSNAKVTGSISIKQIQIFIENVFKRYRQFISEKLNYSQYVAYWRTYSTSIKSAEQILNKKVGLNFNYQANDEDSASLLEGQEYFYNREVGYVFNSYLQNKTKLEKYLYEAILIITFNPNIVHVSLSRKQPFKENMKSIVETMLRRMKSEHGNFRQKCQILYSYISLNTHQPEWEPSLQYLQILKEVASNVEDMNSSNLKYYIFTESKLLSNYFCFEDNHYKRYQKLSFDTSEQYNIHFNHFKNIIKGILQLQAKFHDKKMLIDQSLQYFQSKHLNYQIFPKHLNIELILQWILLKLKYNIQNIERYYELILQVVSLLKTYAKFINEFDKKYISYELHNKIELCLKILFRSITGNNARMLMMLIQQEIWVEINLLLSLNDSLQQNLEQMDLKAYDLIKLSTRVKLDSLQNNYVQGVLQLYNNSMSIYGQNEEILATNSYPLIPIKSYFHDIKHLVAIIIKQFKHLPNNIAVQFYSKLDMKYIDYNIVNSYEKFNYLYGTYSIATVYSNLDYEGRKEEVLARSIAIGNGVQFTSIRMHIDTLNGRYELINKFSKHRLEINRHQKIQTFIYTLQYFFIDMLMLFVNIFYSSHKKQKGKNNLLEALGFFLTKLGRLEIMFQDQIYEQDFVLFPQCIKTRRLKKKFLSKLNFISNQLKRESILLAMQRFKLNYQNELKFFQKFIRFKLMLFTAKYLQVLKIISYLIVIVNNIFLMANSINVNKLTLMFRDPFYILAFINFVDSLLILIIYCIKELPLALKIQKYDLSQGIGYFGRKFNQKSNAKKTLILALMIMTNRRLLYNLIYAIVVGLIFYNPIFASILLLDVLAHVPSLKTLLLSIWRPKYHLFLTLIAYVILQYFFSIFMYFLFKAQANPYCDHLGQCFQFIFLTTFKSVHGFVGFLFQQTPPANLNLHVSAFSLFEDLYVILIYQIIIALILAIVIDSFTVARAEKLKQIDYLSHACIVCNIERSKFNIESKLGFKGHVSINHNLFSYIDFKYSISIKPLDFLSDLELTVLGDKTSTWMPDGKTRELGQEKPQIK